MTPLEKHMAKPFTNPMGLHAPPIPMLSEVLMRICDKHGITMRALKGNGRCRPLVYARQEAAYECVRLTGANYPKIGRAMNRDYSTIIYSVQQYRKRLNAGHA